MNPLLWLYTAGFIFLVGILRALFLAIEDRRKVVRCLANIPGPPWIPILGSALRFSPDQIMCTYQMEREFRTYTERPDSPGLLLIWIGPKPILIVYKPETAKIIMESQELISKPPEYASLSDWVGTGLLTSTGSKWHSRRKMLTPAFHFSILNNFIHVFNRQTDVFIELLDKHADDGYSFDFYKNIKNVAMDIICEAAMGIDLGAQRGNHPEYAHGVREMSEMAWRRMRSPWLWPKPLWYLLGDGFGFDRHLNIVKTFTKSVIAERQAERAAKKAAGLWKTEREVEIDEFGKKIIKRQAFLDLLLDVQDEHRIDDAGILEEVDTFMFEGHDTVSNSMGFTVYMVAHHPHVQEKIFEELSGILETSEREVTQSDIAKMKYLEQTIRESLRMFPVVPIIGRDITEDTVINGTTIPKGVTAMIAPFAVHRDKRYYPHPDVFDPENFSSENIADRHNAFSYIPFSAGPRNCIGQKFATMEQKVVLSRFFRRYKVTAALHEVENRGLPELILKPSRGFPIRIERRIDY